MEAKECVWVNATSSLSNDSNGAVGETNVFGDDSKHEIKYHTLTWPFATFIMMTEVVGVTIFTLPQSLAVVGWVPGLIVIVFCGIWALFTSYLLIDFKLNHPEVHNMGDAGYILFSPFKLGWLGRELCSWGSVLFAVTAVGGSALVLGEALATFDGNRLCGMLDTAVWIIAIMICALPRTYDFGLHYLSFVACVSVAAASIVFMVGSGVEPTPDRVIQATAPQESFAFAFLAITNPVINYAGHFVFFPIISEMQRPIDAKKSVTGLQIFATTFYAVCGIVGYCFLGSEVESPSILSLSLKWQNICWGILLPNALVAAALFCNAAVKILFVRIFRRSDHLVSHTLLGWAVWVGLILAIGGTGFVLAVGVPIFSYLAGIAAAAFAAWFTYGLAGAFAWHDIFYLGSRKAYLRTHRSELRRWAALKKNLGMATLAALTFLGGAFICVAGLYAIIDGIVVAYRDGQVGAAFSCSL